MYFVQNDMTHKSYKDIKSELDKAKKEEVDDALIEGKDIGKQEEKIEIVKEMLKENCNINMIMKVTKLTIEEIKKIENEMK